MSHATASSGAIDSMTADLASLMRHAFVLLRQCEFKVREFRRPGHAESRASRASEIAGLLGGMATLYRLAGAQARAARMGLDGLFEQAPWATCNGADAEAVRSVFRQTTDSLEAFERLIAEFGQQMELNRGVFLRASSVPPIAQQADDTFGKLMYRLMHGSRGSAA